MWATAGTFRRRSLRGGGRRRAGGGPAGRPACTQGPAPRAGRAPGQPRSRLPGPLLRHAPASLPPPSRPPSLPSPPPAAGPVGRPQRSQPAGAAPQPDEALHRPAPPARPRRRSLLAARPPGCGGGSSRSSPPPSPPPLSSPPLPPSPASPGPRLPSPAPCLHARPPAGRDPRLSRPPARRPHPGPAALTSSSHAAPRPHWRGVTSGGAGLPLHPFISRRRAGGAAVPPPRGRAEGWRERVSPSGYRGGVGCAPAG